MPFKDLTLAPADQTLLDRFAAAVRLPDYRPVPGGPAAPDQVFDNIDRDPQIPDEADAGRPASRRDLLETLGGTEDDSEAGLIARGKSLCYSQVQKGTRKDDVTVLGHVHELDKLAGWLHDSASVLSLAETKTFLRDLLRMPGDESARLEEQKTSLAKNTLTRYQLWSFSTGDGREPFVALEPRRPLLLNRLGLGHLLADPMVELVVWSHTLPDGVPAHQPTAWDAGLENPWWRPTGRTEPLDGSGKESGFPEVIHNPIGPQDLATPITEVEP